MDAERVRRQMQEVAVGNYRTFIAAADALLSIREQVSDVDSHLQALVMFFGGISGLVLFGMVMLNGKWEALVFWLLIWKWWLNLLGLLEHFYCF